MTLISNFHRLARPLFSKAALLVGLSQITTAAPSSCGASFVETMKSYRPADISQVGSLNDHERKSFACRGERVN